MNLVNTIVYENSPVFTEETYDFLQIFNKIPDNLVENYFQEKEVNGFSENFLSELEFLINELSKADSYLKQYKEAFSEYIDMYKNEISDKNEEITKLQEENTNRKIDCEQNLQIIKHYQENYEIICNRNDALNNKLDEIDLENRKLKSNFINLEQHIEELDEDNINLRLELETLNKVKINFYLIKIINTNFLI